jgi:ankyrin repeat protein
MASSFAVESVFSGASADLAHAVEADDPARVAAAARPGVVNSQGRAGATVIQLAVRRGRLVALRVLLDCGADPALADDTGYTALHYAVAADDPAVLAVLLERGGDPDQSNPRTGERLLEVALTTNRREQFRMLLRAGADPNATDRMGETALHRAALVDNADAVLELLEAGADPNARNQAGLSFQDYLWLTPMSFYRGQALASRLRVQHWLRRHRVPVTEPRPGTTAPGGQAR